MSGYFYALSFAFRCRELPYISLSLSLSLSLSACLSDRPTCRAVRQNRRQGAQLRLSRPMRGSEANFFQYVVLSGRPLGPGRCETSRAAKRGAVFPIGHKPDLNPLVRPAPPPKKNAGRIRGESRPHDSPHFLIMAGLGKRRLSSCGRCPRRRRSLQSRERQKTRLPVRVLGPGSARFHRGPSRFCGLCPPRIAPCGGS